MRPASTRRGTTGRPARTTATRAPRTGATEPARPASTRPGTTERPAPTTATRARPTGATATSTTCQHAAGNNGTPCPDDGNACTTDTCNGISTTCQHPPGNAGMPCRAAAGECDVAGDVHRLVCDLPGGREEDRTARRARTTATSAPRDRCDGTNVTCQHPAGNAGTACRAAAGECDSRRRAPARRRRCPTDAKKTNGTACTDDGNVCTTDTCNGTSATCQHPAGNAGTACRAAGGRVRPRGDVHGLVGDLPDGREEANGTACTDDGNVCTLDRCDGTSVTCQHPAGNAGTTCRAAAGECDLAETCTGSSTTCPTDAKKSERDRLHGRRQRVHARSLRRSRGDCQHPPGNPGITCRAFDRRMRPAGDLHWHVGVVSGGRQEAQRDGVHGRRQRLHDRQCNGTAAICLHSAGNPGTTCRAAADQCDQAETCTGSSATCPADAKKPNGATCNDGNGCTQTDTCQAGACTGANPVVCTSSDQCHDVGSCNPASGQCSNPVKLDPAAGPFWTSKASLATPRFAPGGVAFGGLTYVFGGCTQPPCGLASTATVEAYDPPQNAWSPRAPDADRSLHGGGGDDWRNHLRRRRSVVRRASRPGAPPSRLTPPPSIAGRRRLQCRPAAPRPRSARSAESCMSPAAHCCSAGHAGPARRRGKL